MNSWESIEDLVQELGLSAAAHRRDDVRREICDEMAELHPDRTGGHFPTEEQETRYHELQDALEFLDRAPGTALVPVEAVPPLVKAIQGALEPLPNDRRAEARSSYITAARGDIRRGFIGVRIGSGTFGVIAATLATVGSEFKEDPLLGPVLATPAGRGTILTLALCAGGLFVLTWIREQREGAHAEWLATEDGRHAMFRHVLSHRQPDADVFRFTVRDLVEAARGGRHLRRFPFLPFPFFLPFGRRGLSPATIERVAKLHLDELESRGVVRRSDAQTLGVVYEMNAEVVGEL